MTLTPEQQAAVSSWIAAGDNISAVQKKLREQFSVSLTYMDTRFLVDDLNLSLKDPAPKAAAPDLGKPTPPPSKGPAAAPARRESVPPPPSAPPSDGDDALPANEAELAEDAEELAEEELMDETPPGGSAIKVEVDKVTLHPGALASGSVTFSDGVVGKWIVDNYGRPGFTEISQPGYRPNSADAQAFMQELSLQLQKRGF